MCLKVCRCIGQQFLIIDFVADDGMRTNHDTFTALDAEFLIPDGDFQSDVALFPLGCAGGEGAIDGEGGDGDIVAVGADDLSKHVADEFRRFIRDRLPARDLGCDLSRDLDLVKICEGAVHGFKVFLDDSFTALAIGLLDGMFDLFNGSFAGQDAADGEEGCLHDGVHASAHAGLFSDFVAVDHIELELLLEDILLDFNGELIPDFIRTIQAVEQESGAGLAYLSMSTRSRKENW